MATSSSPIQEEDYQLNPVINSVSDEVTVGKIRQQNMEIHNKTGCVDASLEFVDQNSEGSNRTEDLSSSNVFSKIVEGNIPPMPTTRLVIRAFKLVFK